ncbi:MULTISPECIES: PadR family transcriptional regulator [unclassified Devosia]|uniref:PadR family transcriptional regulator n=1 Tax=unclassified Devosia TaxID=196773 RepID=UPI000FD823A1|nr:MULTISPECIES: PadR family transcriptional regulator [unclassified Devosia]
MNVRTLCLSILYEGEATGYEIRRRCVEGECSYFIEASFGSIYPALAKLEEEGLVTSRTEQQEGKPAKKVYAITIEGRHAFAKELAEPLGEDVLRSPFLLFARYAHLMPADLVEQRGSEYLQRTLDCRSGMETAATEREMSAADCWVVGFGRAIMEASEKYLRAHMHELIGLAKTERNKDAAE